MAKTNKDPKKKPKEKAGGGPAKKPRTKTGIKAPRLFGGRDPIDPNGPGFETGSISGSGGEIILDDLTDVLDWIKDNPPEDLPEELEPGYVGLVDVFTLMLIQFLAGPCFGAGDGAVIYCKDGKLTAGSPPMAGDAVLTWDDTLKLWYGANPGG